MTPDGMYVGKKRKAHNVETKMEVSEAKRNPGWNVSEKSSAQMPAKKPRIAVQFGSKVPQVVRQRYLDKMILEYTTKLQSLQEVYDKVTLGCSSVGDKIVFRFFVDVNINQRRANPVVTSLSFTGLNDEIFFVWNSNFCYLFEATQPSI